ncbi:MAG: DUF1186 domain-containing protein [Roseiarcus sp.]|jgi:hypothetical protein
MNVDEALRQFGDAEEMPSAALQWALDHWETAAPRFVARIRAFCASSAARDEVAEGEIFFIVHLCGEMREARAYAPLCRLIGENDEAIEFLGDAKTETLNGILINVCDGDPQPLMSAIESERGDEFARAAALEALGRLTRERAILTDEEMRAYLARLRLEMKPRGESFLWQTWAATAANLGYDDMRSEVASLHADDWVDPVEFGLKHFDQQVRLARNNSAGLDGFEADGVTPFGKAVETLASWSYGDDAALAEEDLSASGGYEIETPYVNPLRGIGRNDPCPCGSGKKYKRCCLAG